LLTVVVYFVPTKPLYMKNTKTWYWIVTILFAAFMLWSSIPDVMNTSETVEFMSGQLGYPKYFTPFIGVMKILGVIAILIPGYPRIKEWAYAGLFFDLAGATYSALSVWGFNTGILFMVLPFSLLFISYALYHKVRGQKTVA
jgi:uncharacterized membrane protein YphA (DoxX/SURF4 family)